MRTRPSRATACRGPALPGTCWLREHGGRRLAADAAAERMNRSAPFGGIVRYRAHIGGRGTAGAWRAPRARQRAGGGAHYRAELRRAPQTSLRLPPPLPPHIASVTATPSHPIAAKLRPDWQCGAPRAPASPAARIKALIFFFSPQKFTFSPQSIFCPLFLNEGGRIRKNHLSKLHYRFQSYSNLIKTVTNRQATLLPCDCCW